MEDHRVSFHKKIDNILDYKILSFETYFIPNYDSNVLSASISFSCVFGSIFVSAKSNDWLGA